MRAEMEHIVLLEPDDYVIGLAKTGGASRHGVEDRLDISWRRGDDAKQLAGGRLAFERFVELPREMPNPSFEFVV
ncbi:hypothetical protein NLY43_03030 [Mesorhizobium sp. C416B]|uniref:hypothetical protein n=1 Tax=Mesorhizobium sp. C416B TaxID=2956834 RepID=UPI0025774225|nr:hypothetical protein [Mesorhizobium sp. C416B]WJI66391.1 hypothetical protein NLY43_03030 [Mesorhizobium sp. C416B]